ncbi:MAG: hypothetical protein ACOYXB_12200 [Bacteroidota bacterium]
MAGRKEEGSYSYYIDEDRRIVFVKAHGMISFSQTLKIMDQVSVDPAFKSTHRVLVDLSDMDFHPTFNEINGIRDNIIRLRDVYQDKMALVFTGLLKPLGDLVAEVANMAGMKIRSFYSVDRARKWLLDDQSGPDEQD